MEDIGGYRAILFLLLADRLCVRPGIVSVRARVDYKVGIGEPICVVRFRGRFNKWREVLPKVFLKGGRSAFGMIGRQYGLKRISSRLDRIFDAVKTGFAHNLCKSGVGCEHHSSVLVQISAPKQRYVLETS